MSSSPFDSDFPGQQPAQPESGSPSQPGPGHEAPADGQSPGANDGHSFAAPQQPAFMSPPVPGAQSPFAPAPAEPFTSPPEDSPPAPTPAGQGIKSLFDRITAEVHKVFVGQEELVLGTLVALFAGGHVLIESVPGLGKTLFVRTLGRVLGCQFGRIQFTADLMPSDITGAPVFDMKTQDFTFRRGPVFTQLLLADEINRSPAKTHAALLEIMQEYRVTVEGKSHPLVRPFLVLATQNPIESEGTYNLPEAQLDRFMFPPLCGRGNRPQTAGLHQCAGAADPRMAAVLPGSFSPRRYRARAGNSHFGGFPRPGLRRAGRRGRSAVAGPATSRDPHPGSRGRRPRGG